MTTTQSRFERDRSAWLGLIALFLGICLADRGFAYWRNDGTNFRDAAGNYLPVAPGVKRTWQDNHGLQLGLAGGGLIFILCSVVWLGRADFAEQRAPEGSISE